MLSAHSRLEIERTWLRSARVEDLPELLRLESQFPTDRLSRRSFVHFLRRAQADVLVLDPVDRANGLVGDAVVLYRRDWTVARLYSLVVDQRMMRTGLGRRLLTGAEAVAYARGKTSMVLEVREDNVGALALYHRTGYRNVKRLPGYYQDGAAGLRLAKSLGSDVASWLPLSPLPALTALPLVAR